MKKFGSIFVLLLSLWNNVPAEESTKFLQYKFNERVVITISSSECPFWELKEAYEYAALAKRIDGAMLVGCYTHHKDDIVIRWLHGDETTLPANVFLAKPSL
jgi:hypothetical protein